MEYWKNCTGFFKILELSGFQKKFILFTIICIASVSSAFAETSRSAYELDSVTVTANKQNQNVQDIPDSITVLDSVTIEDAGIDDMTSLSSYVPNLDFYNFGSRRHSITFMRGILSGHAAEPSMGYYVDGVSYAKSVMFDFPLFDVEKIEVLRGAQGTLYGKNTMGGLINVVTRKPGNSTEGYIGAGYGSDNEREFKWNLRGPVVKDKLFMGFSGLLQKSDGFMENDTDADGDEGRHTEGLAARFKLRYKPSEKLDMTMSVDGSKNDDGVFTFRRTERNSFVISGKLPEDDKYHYSHDFEGESETDFWGVSFNAEYDAEFGKVTSVTGYRDYGIEETIDTDFSPYDMTTMKYERKERAITQEFRVASPESSEKAKWLAGVYLFALEGEKDSTYFFRSAMAKSPSNPFNPGTGSKLVDSETENQGAALFGQFSYLFNKKFDVTLGLRYEYEEAEMDAKTVMTPDGGSSSVVSEADDSQDFSALLPKVAFAWHVNDDHMLYTSATAGHRGGGFSASAPKERMAFDEENSWQYELGSKSLMLDKKLMFNSALFYIDIEDEQFSIYDSSTNQPYTGNAGESHRFGFEAETRYTPVQGLDLSASFSVIEAEFDEHADPVKGTDYSGNTPYGVPNYTYNVAAQYRHDLTAKWTGMFRAELSGIGKRYLDDANSVESDPYELVNLRAGLEGEHLEFYVWAKNVFDKHYVVFENTAKGIAEDGEPLKIGASVGYRF